MFKALQRKSSALWLNEFIVYIEHNEGLHPSIRSNLGLQFRPFIREVQGDIKEPQGPLDELACAINFIGFVVPKTLAMEICMQSRKAADNVPEYLSDSSLKQCHMFVSSFFRMIFASPRPDVAERKAMAGNADKNDALLKKFNLVLFNIFKEHHELLLTDVLERDAIAMGLS